MNTSRILEVIVSSYADAVAAEKGGATRLEIVRRLDVGGLTPSIQLVKKIAQTVSIPARVMLRESENFEVDDSAQIQRLRCLAATIGDLPVDGLVLGFVSHGRVDLELTGQILRSCSHLNATFHRAIETTLDPLAEIRQLKSLGQIDRILTNGGSGTWQKKIKTLMRFQKEASPEIQILVGGGLKLQILHFLLEQSTLSEFHTGRAVRKNEGKGSVDELLVRAWSSKLSDPMD